MNTVDAETTAVCRRCGKPVSDTATVVSHSLSDPLQVRECPHCGSVLGIGGHRW